MSLFFCVIQHNTKLVCFLSRFYQNNETFSHVYLQRKKPFPPFLPLYASTHEGLEIFRQRDSGMDARLICDSGRRTKTTAEVKELLRLFLPHGSLRAVIRLRSSAPV